VELLSAASLNRNYIDEELLYGNEEPRSKLEASLLTGIFVEEEIYSRGV
jgi:hypothetical protein